MEYFIGYFATKEEAIEAERGFDETWPNRFGWNKGLRRYVNTGGHIYYA